MNSIFGETGLTTSISFYIFGAPLIIYGSIYSSLFRPAGGRIFWLILWHLPVHTSGLQFVDFYIFLVIFVFLHFLHQFVKLYSFLYVNAQTFGCEHVCIFATTV